MIFFSDFTCTTHALLSLVQASQSEKWKLMLTSSDRPILSLKPDSKFQFLKMAEQCVVLQNFSSIEDADKIEKSDSVSVTDSLFD